MITNLAGEHASRLGLAAHPQQDPQCVVRACEQGINFFFFYGANPGPFGEAIATLARQQREKLISGSGSRTRHSLLAARRKIFSGLNTGMLDVFFAEYVNPAELDENLNVLKLAPMSERERNNWERFGDQAYGRGANAFETEWK